MNKRVNIIEKLHKSTFRDYIGRMNDEKIVAMKVARKFDKDFWDGNRKFGYGGYKYDGRWKSVAQKLIDLYGLKSDSKVLDVGCGKGFLLYEIKILIPKIEIYGFDISKYAVDNAKEEIKDKIFVYNAEKSYPYGDKYFDLVISINTLHNLRIYDLKHALTEIERVGNNKLIIVESYNNEEELFNLQCWALTAESFFSTDEWIWIYNQFGYTGDYDFIYFD